MTDPSSNVPAPSFARAVGYSDDALGELFGSVSRRVADAADAPAVPRLLLREIRDSSPYYDPLDRFDTAVAWLVRYAAGSADAIEVLTELCPPYIATGVRARRLAGERGADIAAWAVKSLAEGPDPAHSRHDGPRLVRWGLQPVTFLVHTGLRLEGPYGHRDALWHVQDAFERLEQRPGLLRPLTCSSVSGREASLTVQVRPRACWGWARNQALEEAEAALQQALGYQAAQRWSTPPTVKLGSRAEGPLAPPPAHPRAAGIGSVQASDLPRRFEPPAR